MGNDTVVVVGVTRTDEWNNLWITPAGGGDEVKVSAKRAGLHPLFQQGKAVMLHWETYKNVPYVSDAKSVEGNLPEAEKLESPPLQSGEEAVEIPKTAPAPQAVGMITKEIGDMMRAEMLSQIFGKKVAIELTKWYRSQTLGITRINYDGKDLPEYKVD